MPAPLHICVIGSGKDVHTRNRTRIFVERGHCITFITENPSGLADIEEIVIPKVTNSALYPIVSMWRHIQQFRQVDADIYMIHFPRTTGAWAGALYNLHPIVVSVMGYDVNFDEMTMQISQFQRLLTKSVVDKADFIIAKTNQLMETMRDYGNYDHKMMRVLWGINPANWQPQPTDDLQIKLELPAEAKVLLSPKALFSFFNQHLIIDAMPRILSQFPNTYLLVSEFRAEPEYKAQLQAQIDVLNLSDYVRFIGSIDQSDLPAYYSLADVVVTVPPSDGMPTAMFEAMSCGTPYMLGNLDHYKEIVQHEDSAYFVEFNADSIAEGVIHLLSDEVLRQRIIDNGKRIVNEVADINKEAERVEQVFYKLIEEHAQGSKYLDTGLLLQAVSLGVMRFMNRLNVFKR